MTYHSYAEQEESKASHHHHTRREVPGNRFPLTDRNKSHLLEHGIMEHLLPYMETENTIIASKLMGLIRLLLDKQG